MSALTLPPEVYSPQALHSAVDGLKSAIRQMEREEVKARVAKKPQAEGEALPPEAVQALELFGLHASAGRGEIEALLSQLEEVLASAPQLHITLAAMPSEGMKKQLVAWVRGELSPAALVTFGYNSALLGGMVVRTGSRIFDLSFRRELLNSGPKLAEALRRV